MWTTLALFLAVQPAAGRQPASAGLSLDNVRPTHGYLGAVRKENTYLPGDTVFIAYEVRNLTVDDAGKSSYGIGMEVDDPAGMRIYRQVPTAQTALNFLGGNTVQSVAHLQIPFEQKPGEYTVKLTVEDKATKVSKTVEQKVRVLTPEFGLIHVATSADRDGKVPRVPVGVVGESIFVNFAVVGFQRDPGKKQPNVEVAMRVLDEKGKATASRPLTGKADADIPADFKLLPLQFGLALTRPGRFTVEVSATDRLSGKTAQVSFPIRVVTMD
jgi:hypothetical protein